MDGINAQSFFAKFIRDPSKEVGVALIDAFCLQDWTLVRRHVVIFRRNEWHALALVSVVKLANNQILDSRVNDVMPLTKKFKFDQDRSMKPTNEGGMIMKIADEGKEIFLEFESISKGRQFYNLMLEVKQSMEKTNEIFSDYSWIEKYKIQIDSTTLTADVSTNDSDDPHSQKSVSRSTIATESKIKCKEKEKDREKKDFKESEQTMMTLLEDMRNSGSDDMRVAYMRMRKREGEYMTADTHKIFIGTWNVNGKVDENLDLSNWLTNNKKSPPPDIYAIGLQEMDLNISNAAFNKSTPNAIEEKWIRALETSFPALPGKDEYKRLKRARLAGIFLVVYCRQSILENIADVVVSSVPTGMFNVMENVSLKGIWSFPQVPFLSQINAVNMGNKGAVGIRFRWNSTTICFICCHLAAGEGEQDLESRNRDYKYIAGRMTFQVDRNTFYIDSHDLVYFFGDLNYRIELDISTVKELIRLQEYAKLHDYDELFRQIAKKQVFPKYEEGDISFPPSYKFDINTDVYDTSDKHRTPSYCDRILWKGVHCRTVSYSSIMSFRMSDHKPVAADFEIGIRRILPELARKTYMAVIRQMDVLHNLYLPKATLSSHSVNFGVLRFMEPKQDSTELKNDGQTPFHFAFKPCPCGPGGKERLFPSWLTVTPQLGTLEPNESIDITFEVYINSYTVGDFNSGKEKVTEATLILNLVGGRDLFITCEGTFQPTCFGLPLQTLIVMSEPAASYNVDEIHRMCIPAQAQPENVTDAGRQPFCFIKELWRLCNHIEKCGKTEPGLFQTPGLHSEIQGLRQALDTTPAQNAAVPLPSCSIHSVSEAMLLFLNSMPDSIIPSSFNPKLLRASKLSFSESVMVIRGMPKANRDVFHYLILFMKHLLENGSANKLDSLVLASIFSEVLTRDIPPERRIEKINFIQFFLDNDCKDLGY